MYLNDTLVINNEKHFHKIPDLKNRTLNKMIRKSKTYLLKNSIMEIHKTASIVHFNATETDEEFIFQKL